jgi:Kef-type K+ transport system membrane component KefB
MAVPVICAETIAITELAILFTRNLHGGLRKVNKAVSIFAGLYFTGIFVYLMKTAYIPLTVNGQWKGWIDVVAVTFYLLGIVPLLGMALLDLGLIYRNRTEQEKLKIHAFFVGMFLVVAHVAMIFGMVDPSLGSGSAGQDMSNMKM